MLKQKTKSKGLKMKKIVLTAVVLISLLGFTACEQSPTEVTVQVPSTESEFKEVKWIGVVKYSDVSPYFYQYVDRGLKLNGVDSVIASCQGSIYKFGTNSAKVCDYIKIRINSAEPYGTNSSQTGDVTVLYKPSGSDAECITYYRYEEYCFGSSMSNLQWEYK